MKKTGRILVYISFLLMLTVSAFSHELPMVEPEAVGLSTERLSRIDKVMGNAHRSTENRWWCYTDCEVRKDRVSRGSRYDGC